MRTTSRRPEAPPPLELPDLPPVRRPDTSSLPGAAPIPSPARAERTLTDAQGDSAPPHVRCGPGGRTGCAPAHPPAAALPGADPVPPLRGGHAVRRLVRRAGARAGGVPGLLAGH